MTLYWRWKISKEARRHLVDALVGTLGRKDDGNEQLVGRRKIQFGFCVAHVLLEIREDGVIAFLLFHGKGALGGLTIQYAYVFKHAFVEGSLTLQTQWVSTAGTRHTEKC